MRARRGQATCGNEASTHVRYIHVVAAFGQIRGRARSGVQRGLCPFCRVQQGCWSQTEKTEAVSALV